MVIHIAVNSLAVHILHNQVRTAVAESAAIEQTCDIGMLQFSQDLSFPSKSLFQLRAAEGRNQLNGDKFSVLIVAALGQIYGSHAAGAEYLADAVRSNPRGVASHSAVEHIDPVFVCQKGKDFLPQLLIVSACVRQCSLARNAFASFEKSQYLLDLFPAFGCHVNFGCISRSSHMRAVFHSRFTVAGERSRTLAVSSNVNPLKKRSSTIRACRGSNSSNLVRARSSCSMSSRPSRLKCKVSASGTRTPQSRFCAFFAAA